MAREHHCSLGPGVCNYLPQTRNALYWLVTELAATQSLPFVHTARRYYRLSVPVRFLDWRTLSLERATDGKRPELVHLEEVKVVTRFP